MLKTTIFKNNKILFLIVCLISMAAALILEFFFFNSEAFATYKFSPINYDMNMVKTEEKEEGAVYYLDGIPGTANNIMVTFACPGDNRDFIDLTYEVKDEAVSENYQIVYNDRLLPAAGLFNNSYARIESYSSEISLKISAEGIDGKELSLDSVTLNVPYPFCFQKLRFFIIFFFFLITISIFVFRLWEKEFDPASKKQLAAYLLTALLSILFLIGITAISMGEKKLSAGDKPYPEKASEMLANGDQLLFLFDAFKNGRLDIDDKYLDVEKKLSGVSNPYNPSLRKEAGVNVRDYAFYKGKYYVFYGAAPVFIICYPYYFLTHRLPGHDSFTFLASLIAIPAIYLCMWELAIFLKRRISFLLFLVLTFSYTFGTQLYLLSEGRNRMNEEAVCFIFLFYLTLFFALRSLRTEHKGLRTAFFSLTALSAALAVETRVTGALSLASCIMPLFLARLIKKDEDGGIAGKVKDALSFSIPLSLFAGIICLYNYLRFESPFEFGAKYQLTIFDYVTIFSSPSAYKDTIISSAARFLFQVPEFSVYFPWVDLSNYGFNRTGNVLYHAIGMGAMWVPLTLGIWLLPWIWKKLMPVERMAVMFIGVFTVLIAWLDYTHGGIAMRYMMDILQPLILVGSMILLAKGSEIVFRGGTAASFAFTSVYLICAVTVIMSVLLIFTADAKVYRTIIEYNPDGYMRAARMFWRP